MKRSILKSNSGFKPILPITSQLMKGVQLAINSQSLLAAILLTKSSFLNNQLSKKSSIKCPFQIPHMNGRMVKENIRKVSRQSSQDYPDSMLRSPLACSVLLPTRCSEITSLNYQLF